jgi:hypothetical protein
VVLLALGVLPGFDVSSFGAAFAAAVAEQCPGVRVAVLAPGETVEITAP